MVAVPPSVTVAVLSSGIGAPSSTGVTVMVMVAGADVAPVVSSMV